MWRYLWGYVCVEEGASKAPPAVVRRICRYVKLYAWWLEQAQHTNRSTLEARRYDSSKDLFMKSLLD